MPVAEPIDIFISYARENRRQAEALYQLLRTRKHRVFLDTQNIRPGQSWPQTIVESLEEALVVCVLWSKAAHDAKGAYVREEARIAKKSGSYFPVCLDDAGVPYGFGEIHYADLIDWAADPGDDRLIGIIEQLEQFLSEQRLTGSLSPSVEDIEKNVLPVATSPQEVESDPIIIDAKRHPLSNGKPPEWASGWGEDEQGVWVEFTLGDVIQRMRWIPPGRFIMGSPPKEPGRFDNEGPQHEITLTRGYWFFDTPCTQALWQVVMGDNPSRFQSPDRPVESVSWDDCQSFLHKINSRLDNLDLSLPTEAQWEYACRAGTHSATYAGEIKLLGDANAPALDPIAWYGGNSGIGFELDNGENASRWLSNRQYDDDPSGTHSVKVKKANPWELYDMLGNVWEWCLDGDLDYMEVSVVDPEGSTKAGAGRVVRGGSWYGKARFVRCACRYRFHPVRRNYSIGFRPARVQS